MDDDTYSVRINPDYKNSVTVVTIPSTYENKKVTTIPQEAFYGCSGLTSVTIPSSVKKIGAYAFYGIRTLSEVYFEDTNGWYAHWAGNKFSYSSKVENPGGIAAELKVMNYPLIKETD